MRSRGRTYCAITISDVLVKLIGGTATSGMVTTYVTWTSTAFPGRLQVPVVQVDQVVG